MYIIIQRYDKFIKLGSRFLPTLFFAASLPNEILDYSPPLISLSYTSNIQYPDTGIFFQFMAQLGDKDMQATYIEKTIIAPKFQQDILRINRHIATFTKKSKQLRFPEREVSTLYPVILILFLSTILYVELAKAILSK